jgi:hypothetical protein
VHKRYRWARSFGVKDGSGRTVQPHWLMNARCHTRDSLAAHKGFRKHQLV